MTLTLLREKSAAARGPLTQFRSSTSPSPFTDIDRSFILGKQIEAVAQAHAPRLVVDAILIGVDLGPNLSITGSLATILWLQAIRREGEDVGFWQFLKVGAVAMPLALIAALAARMVMG